MSSKTDRSTSVEDSGDQTSTGTSNSKSESAAQTAAVSPGQKSTSPGRSNVGKSMMHVTCQFWAEGKCNHGDNCRFAHKQIDGSRTSGGGGGGRRGYFNQHQQQRFPPQQQMQSPIYPGMPQNVFYNSQQFMPVMGAPPPIYLSIPNDVPVFSIDVECVATTIEHTGRSVAQIALVDSAARPVFSALIKQEQPVLSYITELTGLTKEKMDSESIPLTKAMEMLRSHLPQNAVVVGQNVLKDVQWLELVEGEDYSSLIDLSALFRVWNPQRNEYTAFGQDHCARVWLGIESRSNHDAVQDAIISMSLFNAYRSVQNNPMQLQSLQYATLNAPRIPSFSATYPVIDNCCMGNRKKCICGAPWL